eukprot:gb/GECG01015740.1/.p1 GENE.gb/GECG01015740.1/~~gb/GECG01015740.1/.p1  ORF type:complete len:390 (+),score=83.69 gb/GECG01015740.1/:1-1170(+)
MSGSSTSNVVRGEAGIYTQEGNAAGDFANRLSRTREKQQKEYESKRKEIMDNSKRVSADDLTNKFTTHTNKAEQAFKAKTVGLVSADEFRQARLDAEKLQKDIDDKKNKDKQKKKGKKRPKATKLSFNVDELAEEDEVAESVVAQKATTSSDTLVKQENGTSSTASGDSERVSTGGSGGTQTEEQNGTKRQKKLGKDPNVRTDFLPDREREEEEARLREKLKQEWLQEQERIKNEKIEITYSYYDGSGHRRSIEVPKGTSIGKFLEKVRQQLSKEFPELKQTTNESLMYVKEDIIIPHHYTFYDLIQTKARGKSGPLFRFDVKEDIRMRQDYRLEKDESHPGKIVQRRWYESNKHIFPASRWEIYDPAVQRDKYTTHGDEIQPKKKKKS